MPAAGGAALLQRPRAAPRTLSAAVSQHTPLENTHTGQVVVTQKAATVWVHNYSIADLPPSEPRNQQNWPLPSQEVGSVAKVLVRRNEESKSLATSIAHQLVTELGGVIRWDGMEYWKRYETALPS